ncbi:hydroxymethylbilane synthase [Paenibacillus roseipurpureus]|uniref:Porphobilinogen deaminase n=1 Tax=Paenibacillus roseopurpureus TaxID=2918901 RepID=A0AA96LRE6_9BACL|nr:hydroxymethylbilane synthase [Paenibacillus sp. MBLB1832]WNR45824.1 hydroxymethylbilane synthase [Paenibacillus sp. MBLB1832]
MRTIIVGTRQSALALTQTGQAVELLKQLAQEHGIECQFEIRKIVTKGDRILDVTLSKVGGKGLFVKEIEQALTDGEIDIAVHSMKDMPFELPEGLVVGAIPQREDARDALITRGYSSLEELPQGALVGTSSLRRASQLQHLRPDLRIESVRGNIDSRLRKLDEENFDAIMLAAAGLHRIGWQDRISAYLPPEQCLPAVGQGALCIECRGDDTFVLDLLSKFQHEPTALAVRAERAFLGRLNGGCQVPLGAYASVNEDSSGGAALLTLTGMVGTPDGATMLKETASGNDPEALGLLVADKLIAQGAERILAEVRE